MIQEVYIGEGISAERTDVLDAFDEDDPIDIDVQVSYQRDLRKSQILREYKCINISGLCPNSNEIILAKELEYKRVINTLIIDTSIGVYKDVEIFVSMPVVLDDSMELGLATNYSTINPPSGNALFTAPFKGRGRSGFGDMSAGVKYSPFSQEHDPFYPSWMLGFTYTIPTGSIKKATNSNVGEGVHKIKIETEISRRISFVEPYFGFSGTFKFGSASGLFKNYGETQDNINPGAEMGIVIGSEIIPWEVAGMKQKFVFDFGFKANYIFEGRGYSEIFDALGSSACDPQDGCYYTTYARTLKNDPVKNPLKTDGITDIEPYGVLGTWAGFSLRPIEYIQLNFQFFYDREMDHFITFADAGKDLDGKNDVEYENSLKDNEYNPVYLAEIDKLGKRLKTSGANVIGIKVGLTGRF
jgi:hypothetical protein